MSEQQPSPSRPTIFNRLRDNKEKGGITLAAISTVGGFALAIWAGYNYYTNTSTAVAQSEDSVTNVRTVYVGTLEDEPCRALRVLDVANSTQIWYPQFTIFGNTINAVDLEASATISSGEIVNITCSSEATITGNVIEDAEPIEGWQPIKVTIPRDTLGVYSIPNEDSFTVKEGESPNLKKYYEGQTLTAEAIAGGLCSLGGAIIEALPGHQEKPECRFDIFPDDDDFQAWVDQQVRIAAVEGAQECQAESLELEEAAITEALRQDAIEQGVPPEIVDQVLQVEFTGKKPSTMPDLLDRLRKDGVLSDGDADGQVSYRYVKKQGSVETNCSVADDAYQAGVLPPEIESQIGEQDG